MVQVMGYNSMGYGVWGMTIFRHVHITLSGSGNLKNKWVGLGWCVCVGGIRLRKCRVACHMCCQYLIMLHSAEEQKSADRLRHSQSKIIARQKTILLDPVFASSFFDLPGDKEHDPTNSEMLEVRVNKSPSGNDPPAAPEHPLLASLVCWAAATGKLAYIAKALQVGYLNYRVVE